MNSSTKQILLVVSSLSLALAARASVEAVSEVYVATGTVLHGTGGAESPLNLFSSGIVRPVQAAGLATAVSGAVLTDTTASWSDDQFNGANGPHYVEFDSGLIADVAGTSAAGQSLTLAGSIEGEVQPGDHYRVRKHATIASVFGTSNEAGLAAGLNPSVADNILLQTAPSMATATYFYSTFGALSGWRTATYAAAANTVIHPAQGIMVRRKTAGDVVFFSSGEAKPGLTIAPIFTGYNLVGTLKAATALPISGLNVYTGDPLTGLAAGDNPSLADNLLVVSPTGATTTYFYSSFGALPGWRTATYAPAGTVPIQPGSAFWIQRKSPRASFDWTLTAE